MNIDEVMEFAPYVQGMMDEYVKHNHVIGQCLEVSIDRAAAVEMLIKRRLPDFTRHSITLEIGNMVVDGQLQFDEIATRRFAENLPPKAVRRVHTGAYHAWLQFDGSIIDLTAIYTAFAARNIKHLEPGALFISSEGVWAPQDYGFRYVSYRSWSMGEIGRIG